MSSSKRKLEVLPNASARGRTRRSFPISSVSIHNADRRSSFPLAFAEAHTMAATARRKLATEANVNGYRLRHLAAHANLLDVLEYEIERSKLDDSCRRHSVRSTDSLSRDLSRVLQEDDDDGSSSSSEDDEDNDDDFAESRVTYAGNEVDSSPPFMPSNSSVGTYLFRTTPARTLARRARKATSDSPNTTKRSQPLVSIDSSGARVRVRERVNGGIRINVKTCDDAMKVVDGPSLLEKADDAVALLVETLGQFVV